MLKKYKMELVINVDNNWKIGYNGGMLYHIKDDLNRFRDITMGGILIMGRRTFEALPNKKPLFGRDNIVLTKDASFNKEGVIVINDLNDLPKTIDSINSNNKRIFLIGGGMLIKQLIDQVEIAWITMVDTNSDLYDTDMPNISEDKNFVCVDKEGPFYSNDLPFYYLKYERIKN